MGIIKNTTSISNKKPYIIGITLAGIFILFATIYSYYYFSKNTNNQKESEPAAKMEINYEDGKEINYNIVNDSVFFEKNFSVSNSGNLEALYDVYLSDIVNDFENKSNLVFYLTSMEGKSTKVIEFPTEDTKIVSEQVITPNTTHKYSLTIEYKGNSEKVELDKDNILKGNVEIKENKDFKIEYSLSLKNHDESKKTAEGICIKNNLDKEFCIYPNYWYMNTGASNQSVDDAKSVEMNLNENYEVRFNYKMLYSTSDDSKATVGPNENHTCTAYYDGKIECSILNNDKSIKQKYVLSQNGEVID